jgi:Acyl-CoA dehydrogenase, C-terminal domain
MEAQVIQAAERELMSATLRRLAEEFDGTQLSEALDDFGFAELLTEEPRAAVSSLFDAAGRTGSMPAAFQDVLLLPLSGVLDDVTPSQSVVLPVTGAQLAGSLDGEAVSLRGLVIGARPATAFLAPVAMGGQTAWVRVADPSALSTRVVGGLDPALGMVEVSASGLRATVLSAGPAAAAGWDAVVTAGRRALGYQIVGAATQMLDLAVAHARVRVQFGRPIGSFQAVRNRLADTYVAREAAAAALELAWEADDEYLAGMLAKSLAGRAARIAATHCQQVLAGIGFTAEHPFHHFLARALVLDSVLGSATELRSAIGAQLVAAQAIPRLVEL